MSIKKANFAHSKYIAEEQRDALSKAVFVIEDTDIIDKLHHKKYLECLEECKIAFKSSSKAEILLKLMGFCCSKLDQNDEAIKFYLKYEKKYPSEGENLFNLASVYLRTGNLHKAEIYLKKTFKVDPTYKDLNKNFGCLYDKKNEIDKAIKYYLRANLLNPDDIEIPLNIVSMYKRNRQYNKGVDHAILLLQKNYELKNNIDFLLIFATCLYNIGKIDNAIEIYEKILLIDGSNTEASNQLHSLRVQDYYFGSILDTHGLSDPKNAFRRTLAAIGAYKRGDFLGCSENMIAEDELNNYCHYSNEFFVEAYQLFLNKLIKENIEKSSSEIEKKIFHIGESHCLSYAHTKIFCNGITYKISPSIIFGAKAFHLGKNEDNPYRRLLDQKLCKFVGLGPVFLSFGEIDCRLDEGFIKLNIKDEQKLFEVIKVTVRDYVMFVHERTQNYSREIYLLNVPAPVLITQPDSLQKKRSKIIQVFNNCLSDEAQKYNFGLIDLYTITSDRNGFSNGLFHIDSVHLRPNALMLALAQ